MQFEKKIRGRKQRAHHISMLQGFLFGLGGDAPSASRDVLRKKITARLAKLTRVQHRKEIRKKLIEKAAA